MDQPDSLVVVSLRRYSSDKSWGFSIQGGSDHGLPAFVHKITRNSIAHKAGLEPGDVIVKVCQAYCVSFANSQVKAEILRAGNELDFTVKKRAFNVAAYSATATGPQQSRPQQRTSGVSEERVGRQSGPAYKNIKPKTYQILESQLPQSETGEGPLPSSYRDRPMEEHSPYIKAQGPTIQRAFGEF